MRRVVITGMGIISSIGNNVTEVEASLRAGKSGIVAAPSYTEHGFRSQVHGMPQITLEEMMPIPVMTTRRMVCLLLSELLAAKVNWPTKQPSYP